MKKALALLLVGMMATAGVAQFSIMKQSYSNVAFFAIIACVAYIAVAAAMPPPPPPPSPTVSKCCIKDIGSEQLRYHSGGGSII